MKPVLRVVWYRYRATFSRRWTGYASIVLIVALVGGVALASLAGARRTQSSFAEFVASTNPSDLAVVTGLFQPAPTGYDPGVIREISRLPHVTRVESEAGYESAKVDANGYLLKSAVTSGAPQVALYSSIGGEFFDMDHLVVLKGRMPNSARPDEVAMTPDAARLLGVGVGGTFPLGVIGDVQSTMSCTRCRATFHTTVKVVGIAITSAGLVVDDTDRTPTIFATPAFTRPLYKCCVDPTISFVQVTGGERALAAVESEIAKVLPANFPHLLSPTKSASTVTAQRVIEPDVIALYIFGLIVSLVALILAGQLIARVLQLDSRELETVRALGASTSMTSWDGPLGVIGAVVLGALLAGLVAFALSPLAPIGPVGPVYPHRGLSLDVLVLGVGALALAVILSAVAVAVGVRRAPHRTARRRDRSGSGSSLAVRFATGAGLSAPAVCGLRFALDPGRGRQAAPVRSAVLGAIVAVAVVVATLTVGASLNALASRPPLYGWNWTVGLDAAGGVGVLPQAATARALAGDRDVAAWSGMDFGQLQIDGRSVPVLGSSPHATVAPALLSGHGLESSGQIVLGTQTLDELHQRLGGVVRVSSGQGATTRLRIVGTATLPAIGGNPHTEMGTGAVVDYHLIPASQRNLFHLPGGGPNIAFVRLKHPEDRAARRRLNAVAAALTRAAQDNVKVIPVQRPAEIASVGTLRTTPSILAVALAAGAILALGLTLVASVRRRRRELAMLKVLGFTRRQLSTAVAWQSTISALIGVVVGIPMGVVSGRELWTLFARGIHAVPVPTVPVVGVVLVAVGAVAFANLLAILPGRSAARTPSAIVLRAE